MYKEDFDLEAKICRVFTDDIKLFSRDASVAYDAPMDMLKSCWRTHSLVIGYLKGRGGVCAIMAAEFDRELAFIETVMTDRGFEFHVDERGRRSLPMVIR